MPGRASLTKSVRHLTPLVRFNGRRGVAPGSAPSARPSGPVPRAKAWQDLRLSSSPISANTEVKMPNPTSVMVGAAEAFIGGRQRWIDLLLLAGGVTCIAGGWLAIAGPLIGFALV